MNETPQEYTQRILGYVDGKNSVAVQKSTPKKIERLIARLSPAQLRRRPAPEKWSIVEILAHLAETELVCGYRMRMILSSSGTPIQAFDQDAWARAGNYAKADAKASLKMFRTLRESNLALLGSLPPEKWEYFGMHAERGKETIAHMAKMFAGHDINHLMQIEHLAKQGRAARK
jgi:hypothetical protein